jgi:hypothetical protein
MQGAVLAQARPVGVTAAKRAASASSTSSRSKRAHRRRTIPSSSPSSPTVLDMTEDMRWHRARCGLQWGGNRWRAWRLGCGQQSVT